LKEGMNNKKFYILILQKLLLFLNCESISIKIKRSIINAMTVIFVQQLNIKNFQFFADGLKSIVNKKIEDAYLKGNIEMLLISSSDYWGYCILFLCYFFII
jgi:hypothetical protein